MKNKSKELANEAWRMLPDSCKEIMKGSLEKTFKESLAADIEHVFTELKNWIREKRNEADKKYDDNSLSKEIQDMNLGKATAYNNCLLLIEELLNKKNYDTHL